MTILRSFQHTGQDQQESNSLRVGCYAKLSFVVPEDATYRGQHNTRNVVAVDRCTGIAGRLCPKHVAERPGFETMWVRVTEVSKDAQSVTTYTGELDNDPVWHPLNCGDKVVFRGENVAAVIDGE